MGGRPHKTAAAVSRASEGETLSAGGQRLSSPPRLKFGRPDSCSTDSVLTGAARRPCSRPGGGPASMSPCYKGGPCSGRYSETQEVLGKAQGVSGGRRARGACTCLAPFKLAGEPCLGSRPLLCEVAAPGAAPRLIG